jgi:hypothetical protein
MYIAWVSIFIVVLVAILLTLMFVVKMNWLTKLCIIVILASTLMLFNLAGFRAPVFLRWGKMFVFIFLLLDIAAITILLVQFFRWLFTTASGQASVNPAERNRILKMVEEGKINSDEAKELLDAMGKSSALRGEDRFSRIDFLMLASVSLVVLGFFLPWNYINMPDMMNAFGRIRGYQAGYDAGAIGWALFSIAIASAVPVFITPRNFLYKISMLQIFLTIIGIVLAISLMILIGGHIGAGIILCLIGFILALTASIAKLKTLAA